MQGGEGDWGVQREIACKSEETNIADGGQRAKHVWSDKRTGERYIISNVK